MPNIRWRVRNRLYWKNRSMRHRRRPLTWLPGELRYFDKRANSTAKWKEWPTTLFCIEQYKSCVTLDDNDDWSIRVQTDGVLKNEHGVQDGRRLVDAYCVPQPCMEELRNYLEPFKEQLRRFKKASCRFVWDGWMYCFVFCGHRFLSYNIRRHSAKELARYESDPGYHATLVQENVMLDIFEDGCSILRKYGFGLSLERFGKVRYPMKYITGLHALDLPCSLETCGDFHHLPDWKHPMVMNTEKAFFGDWGLEWHEIPGQGGKRVPVANHIRACLDMLEMRDYANLQGMNAVYLDAPRYNEFIFEQVLRMRALPYWKEIDAFMESEYFMFWVRVSWLASRRAEKGWRPEKPLWRCVIDTGELRQRYRAMTPEERQEAVQEAALGFLRREELRLPHVVALCILLDEYFDEMDDGTKQQVCDVLRYQPCERFEYIVEMEAGPEVDRKWLADSFLAIMRKLGLVFSPWEQGVCERAGRSHADDVIGSMLYG